MRVPATRRTIADALKEEGRKEGQWEGSLRATRQSLLRLLQVRLEHVPKEIEAPIKRNADLKQLQEWLDRFAKAADLDAWGLEKRFYVVTIERTVADCLKDEGRKVGRREGALQALQQNLLRLLQIRFGQVPVAIQTTIKQTTNHKQLNAWLDRFAKATTLDEVGIGEATRCGDRAAAKHGRRRHEGGTDVLADH